MTSQNQARLQLVFAALLFSTGGAAIKASTLTGWQVASFRSGVAAFTLLLLVPATRRGWGWKPALVGVTYAATLILFVTANKLTTSANTIFLQATSPVYLLLLGPLFLKEPVRRRDLWVVAAVLAGLVLFFVGNEAPVVTAPDPARGNILALLSGRLVRGDDRGPQVAVARVGGCGAGDGGAREPDRVRVGTCRSRSRWCRRRASTGW